MNTYIVADGGGTKTEFLFFDECGKVLSYAKTAGTNATFIPAKTAAANVMQGIGECITKAGENAAKPCKILLFIPGFSVALEHLTGISSQAMLMDDFWNAYYGALAAPTGIVALAGTGSFVAGRVSKGQLFTAGGWGPLFGDDGSGYRLGVLCLRAITNQYDRGIANSILTNLVLEKMEITQVVQLQTAAYRPELTREEIAKLSYVVEDAANMGDNLAISIFDDLANELCMQAAVLAQRIKAPTGSSLSVTGGMLKSGKWFSNAFEKSAAIHLPHLNYCVAKYCPLVGAALYLLAELQGNQITASIARRIHNDLQAFK